MPGLSGEACSAGPLDQHHPPPKPAAGLGLNCLPLLPPPRALTPALTAFPLLSQEQRADQPLLSHLPVFRAAVKPSPIGARLERSSQAPAGIQRSNSPDLGLGLAGPLRGSSSGASLGLLSKREAKQKRVGEAKREGMTVQIVYGTPLMGFPTAEPGSPCPIVVTARYCGTENVPLCVKECHVCFPGAGAHGLPQPFAHSIGKYRQ